MNQKTILDVACGSRMFWFNRNHPNAIYMDKRKLKTKLCDGRILNIDPDIIGDFTKIPFPNDTFYHVIFDPPHLTKVGKTSWLAKKYGILPDDWEKTIRMGFNECMRVLKPYGTLVFKWNEEQIKLREILKVIEKEPLYGNRRSKTHWLVFIK